MAGTLTIRRKGKSGAKTAALAAELRRGLAARPVELPCRLFYDDLGSRLFEEICRSPEYYVPQAETEILAKHGAEIIERSSAPSTLVELGSGNSTKTRLLIEAALAGGGELRYLPIDVSASAVEESTRALLADYPRLSIEAVIGEYQEGLDLVHDQARKDKARHVKLVLWLGSNIGNLGRQEAAGFLAKVGDTMAGHDRLLVGIDMRKEKALLEAAYDDAAGVTARFNLNILAHINRALAADFDLSAFTHRAVYKEDEGRIEMRLVSKREQRITIKDLGMVIEMAGGEFIHTESSYKYSPPEIDELARRARLRLEARWTDSGERFSSVLLARP